jgi:hypothetical protein
VIHFSRTSPAIFMSGVSFHSFHFRQKKKVKFRRLRAPTTTIRGDSRRFIQPLHCVTTFSKEIKIESDIFVDHLRLLGDMRDERNTKWRFRVNVAVNFSLHMCTLLSFSGCRKEESGRDKTIAANIYFLQRENVELVKQQRR